MQKVATRRWEMDRQLVLLIRQCAIPETKEKKKRHQCKLINFGRTSACFKPILGISWLSYSWCALITFSVQKCFAYLILGSTHKVVIPPWYKGGGAGVCWWSPSLEFLIWCSLKDFTFSGKPLIFSKKWGEFYGLWRCWRPVTSSNMVVITKN